ncbi:tetratricopeptide repeat protein [Vacuolonema iberomarrocanum]|uniref:tetratricopeptide repeat protein n=1 Tax=Vacuolonema iberomarrocanum TaxID=3454632 RepID=UPI003F6DECD2
MRMQSTSASNMSNSAPSHFKPPSQERAERHLKRAKDQFKMKRYNEAVKELRDAIKLDPKKSEFHAWLAKVQLKKGLTGMTNISVRQALKLDPDNELALECQKLAESQSIDKSDAPTEKHKGLGSLLTRKLF